MSVPKISFYLLLIAFLVGEISFYGLVKTSNPYYLLSTLTANTAIIITIYNMLSSKTSSNKNHINYYIYLNTSNDSLEKNCLELPVKKRN